MKKLVLFFVFWLAVYSQTFAQDTVRIVLDNETKLLITSPDRASLRKLKYLDINHLVRDAIRDMDKDNVSKTEKRVNGNNANGNNNDNNCDDCDDEHTIRINVGNGVRISRRASYDTLLKQRKWMARNRWDVDLGLANFMEAGKFPDNQNKPYGLSTIGSYYAGVSSNQVFDFYKSPIKLKIGIELSLYSFRLQNNNYITRNTAGDSVQFRNYNLDFQKDLKSSRLTVGYVNIPFALRLGMLKRPYGNHFITFDLGGYVGYRLASYAGIRTSDNGSRQRTNNSFLLNNWRYGLEFAVKIDHFRLFSRYDLNSMFADGQAPKLNLWTLGVRI